MSLLTVQHLTMAWGERVIQRVTVMGDLPKAAAPSRWSPYRDAFSAGSWRDMALWSFLKEKGKPR